MHLATKKVFLSRDVLFVESVFPFHTITSHFHTHLFPTDSPLISEDQLLCSSTPTLTESHISSALPDFPDDYGEGSVSSCCANNWPVTQMDVQNAFLHGELHEEVYMSLPPCYVVPVSAYTGVPVSAYTGVPLVSARSAEGIYLNQRKYILDIIHDVGFSQAKTTLIPMAQHHTLLINKDSPLLPNASSYRQLVGRLIYLTITRPDITYPVHVLSQFLSAPKVCYLDAAYKVVYDWETTFGLKTGGRIEFFLVSLLLTARWEYDHAPEEGSEEWKLLDAFVNPNEWI
ncbi:hypothetical protein AgCh_038519 [Apium graveolens]